MLLYSAVEFRTQCCRTKAARALEGGWFERREGSRGARKHNGRLGPATAKNVPIAFTSGAAIFSRIANWLLVPSWVEREGMGSRVKHLRIENGKLEVGHFAIRSGWKTAQDAARSGLGGGHFSGLALRL